MPEDRLAFLDTTDEESEEGDDEEDDMANYINLHRNLNTLPQDMTPYEPCNNAKNTMFPQGIRTYESGTLPIHPRQNFISYEECNMVERARLINLIHDTERTATAHCTARCDNKKKYYAYRQNLFNKWKESAEKYHTTDNFCRVVIKKDRKQSKILRENRQLTRLQFRARRDQTYYSLRLQAVINGIAYRRENPNHTFVIYLREGGVILQRTQMIPPVHVPQNETQRHRHRELRNLETNHVNDFNRTNFTDAEPQFCCDCNFETTLTDLSVTNMTIMHATSIFEVLGSMDTEMKLIITPKNKDMEKIMEMKRGVRDLFDIFQATIKGWKDNVQYDDLYYNSELQMKNLEKIVGDSIQSSDTIIKVLSSVKFIIMLKLGTSLEWYNHMHESQNHIFQTLRNGVHKLV